MKLLLTCAAFAIAGLASPVTVVSSGLAADATQPEIQQIDLSKLTHKQLARFPGVSNAFLLGAFNKPGLYAAHGIMAAGTKFPPHQHPDVRLSIVVSGTMYLGQGETFEEDKLVAYPVGTVAITPANTPHFMFAKDGDVKILEIGAGPSGAKFFE
ncbi:MAG: cupin domain-containing protein [Pseudomonadota bacterium]